MYEERVFFVGFGDFLKSVGGAVANGMAKKMDIANQARDEGMSMSADELLRNVKNSSGDRKVGYLAAAKKRGLL